MRYPNGVKKRAAPKRSKKKAAAFQKASTYSNRGMGLEQLLEKANHWYFIRNKAAIQKVPTPMKNIRLPGGGSKAVYTERSTVDFLGLGPGGKGIAFEAKSTELKTRFKLELIKEHQWTWLEATQELGGHAFFIIEFSKLNRIFYLPFLEAKSWKDEWDSGGAASIPLHFFTRECHPAGTNPLDYLKWIKE